MTHMTRAAAELYAATLKGKALSAALEAERVPVAAGDSVARRRQFLVSALCRAATADAVASAVRGL